MSGMYVFASPYIPPELVVENPTPEQRAQLEALLLEQYPPMGNDMWCDLTDNQQASLEYVVKMFDTHADTKIAKRLFDAQKFQDLSSAYTDEFIQSVKATLAMCDIWWPWSDTMMWEMNPYYSYDDFIEWLTSYIQMTMTLKQFAPQVEAYDPIVPAMRQLRDHLAGDMIAELVWTDEKRGMYLDQSGSVNMTFAMNGPDGMASAELGIETDILSDRWGAAFSGTADVGGNISVRMSDDDFQLWGRMWLNMRFVDGHLYMWLTDVMVDENMLQFENAQERTEYKEAMQMIKLFDGKFIDIPLVPDEEMMQAMYADMSPEMMWQMGGMPWMMPMPWMMAGDIQWMIAEQQQMIAKILTQDRMTTYAKAGNTYYVWFNPAACESVSGMWSDMVTWCLEMWMDMVELTDGQWMMEITIDGGVTSMGITDQFMSADDKAPADMADMINRPLMSWTADKIVMLDIPFGLEKNWWVSFKDGNLSIQWNIPNNSYDRETGEMKEEMINVDISGTISDGTWDIEWVVRGVEDVDVMMTMDMVIWDDRTTWSLTIQADNDTPDADFEKILMKFEREDESAYVAPVEISAPDASDILELDVLMNM